MLLRLYRLYDVHVISVKTHRNTLYVSATCRLHNLQALMLQP
jgi:hypothetical protein